jgi:hypothetical protein
LRTALDAKTVLAGCHDDIFVPRVLGLQDEAHPAQQRKPVE